MRIIPPIVSFVARRINFRLGSILLTYTPVRMRNFTTTIATHGISMKIFTGESGGRRMYYFGDFENEQVDTFLSLVDEKSILYDIGANIGYYSLLATKKGATAYAFEPSPQILPWLDENIQLNKMESRVTVVKEAVSDRDGEITFYPHREGNFGVGKIFEDKTPATRSASAPPVIVKTRTLDHFAEQLGVRPNLIKMDIEGAEYFILNNPPALLRGDNAPTLFIEFHPDAIVALGGSTEALMQGLINIGYRRYRIGGSNHADIHHSWEVFSKQDIANQYLEKVI